MTESAVHTVTWRCPQCHTVQDTDVTPPAAVSCETCGFTWNLPQLTPDRPHCPLCQTGELYVQKDFNIRLGIAIILVAAAVAWWTYGLSLVAATLLDWFLYRRVPEVVICYYCQAHFRNLSDARRFPAFDLLKHDRFRTRWEQDHPE